MSDKEQQRVYEELQQIRETITSCKDQIRETITSCEDRVENLEYEFRLKVELMSEEIDRLNSLVNPWSEDCKSVADWNE